MIPALIFYILKRLKGKSNIPEPSLRLKKLVLKLKAVLFFFAIIISFSFNDINTREDLTYQIIKNNRVIGVININKNIVEDSVTYILESNISAKFLFKFDITGKEKSIYKNGVLVYSSVFRTVNGKTKVDHKLKLVNGEYSLQSSETHQALDYSKIKQNLITLYFNEPIGLKTVYCDNLKEMVNIYSLGGGSYKVEFTNGNYNIFHYENRKCIKIEAISTLFNVTLIPVES